MALQTGILVAFTQLIPEHQVQLFGVLKARVKVRGPFFFFSLIILSCCSPSDFAHDLCDDFYRVVYRWLPMSMDRDSIRMACIICMAALLQEELRRRGQWYFSVWR